MLAVRPALSKDEEPVFKLAAQLSPKFVVDHAVFSASFPKLLQADDVYLRVAVSSENVIGYLLGWSRLAFYSNGAAGWVQEIVVNPEYRRSGVGKRLMDDFESWSAKRECRLVSLATRGAADFYQAIGYRESAAYFKKALTEV